ncbi:membrane protein [Burkholderia cepacia]|uniref:Membrane protein n=1 Tax=Burkholderia cepacia TaxID=292 RepID=A0A0J5W971_BURCE|nr:membrane protein [Burkholderia cepacia]KML47455.1 membrane protein [Burkholderia cepacia]
MATSNPFNPWTPTVNPVRTNHWTARVRAWRLSLGLILVNVAGAVIATCATNRPIHQPGAGDWPCSFLAWLHIVGAWIHGDFSSLCAIRWPWTIILISGIATVLVGAPLIAFLCLGWYARYDEFRNSLKNDALDAYLKRFWSKSLLKTIRYAEQQGGPVFTSDTERLSQFSAYWPTLGDRLFANIYHAQYGLWVFVPPFLILLVVTYAITAVVAWLCTVGACASTNTATCIFGLGTPMVVSAIAGALMFVVSDSVLNIRRRALNASDVYWYSLRLFLAMPLAVVAADAPSSGAPPHVLIAFTLTTLPVEEIIKVIRRIAATNVTALEIEKSKPDELLQLSGVTTFVTATLHAEGITSIEQMAAADPVTLSIRTGFPFRFTLRLGSQAIVRRHFGTDASKLLPIGLADVVPIYLLVLALDGNQPVGVPLNRPQLDEPETIVNAAATCLFSGTPTGLDMEKQAPLIVKMKFRQIAAEEYTSMLARITPLDPAL